MTIIVNYKEGSIQVTSLHVHKMLVQKKKVKRILNIWAGNKIWDR